MQRRPSSASWPGSRQLAESVQYAHSNGVVHRGLNPAAVVAHSGDEPRILISGWRVAGAAEGAGPSVLETQGGATRIFGLLEAKRQGQADRVADAYIAPEGQWRPDASRSRLDVFALGALTYLLVAGHDPATSAVELKQRLEREHGLDLAADLPQVSGSLRSLVLAATNPVVSERLRDVNAFLEKLSSVERELGTSSGDTEIDPLDAPPGTVIGGRFELVRRLGSGSTAVGLLVRDRDFDGEARVLKVAIDDNAAKRLDAEAEVLAALNSRKQPRIVRIVETSPVQVGDRKALLLESAGEETLADVLRDRRSLSLDLLDRWGIDLLEALVSLDEAGVDHRDIKPSNLGVREQKSDRAKHLVLFDFSLAKASAATISAGTPLTSRLSRFTGIVDATKREIRGRAKQWREKFADQLPTSTAPEDDVNRADPFTAPDVAAPVG